MYPSRWTAEPARGPVVETRIVSQTSDVVLTSAKSEKKMVHEDKESMSEIRFAEPSNTGGSSPSSSESSASSSEVSSLDSVRSETRGSREGIVAREPKFQSRMSRVKPRPTCTSTRRSPRGLWKTRLRLGGRASSSINHDLPISLPITARQGEVTGIVAAAAVGSHIPRCTISPERMCDQGSVSRSLSSSSTFHRRRVRKLKPGRHHQSSQK